MPGETLMFERDYEAAVKEYREALELDPDKLEISPTLFSCYFKLEDFEHALQEQQIIVEMAPTEANYYNLGVAYA